MMKRLIILSAVVICMIACTSAPNNSVSEQTETRLKTDTVGQASGEPAVQTLCFQKLEGAAKQDTTFLRVIIDGDKVTGNFGHYPKEKDRRVGLISAVKDGELIKGQWVYMQEGVNDTLPVEFKLSGDRLVQKNYTIDPKTGREVLSKASVFNMEFEKIDCRD